MPETFALEIGDEVPEYFRSYFEPLDFQFPEPTTIEYCSNNENTSIWFGEYIFAAVAQFPTIADEVSIVELQSLYSGNVDANDSHQELLLPQEFEDLFQRLWGDFDQTHVVFFSKERIVPELWGRSDRIAIVPFEQIQPKMKVLSVNGQNPMIKSFAGEEYALKVQYCITGDTSPELLEGVSTIPTTNRDPEKMTSILLTGVTALTREIAYKMEQNGVTYPAEKIVGWFDNADFIHISNEVAFTEECPVPEPPFSPSRFCSRTEYFELLDFIGANLIELTGNHLLDYGEDAFQETLTFLTSSGLTYYGGGIDAEDAAKPLLVSSNGNQFAFFGCNVPGPDSVFADNISGGANHCNLPALEEEVRDYSAKGYLVIVTFQHYEACQVLPMSAQKQDMVLMAEAGATIVSGSQAHCPQTMAFVEDGFVHYGLGNLFFDQMWDVYRNGFLDYHVFYDGRYMGVQLMTTRLEDASQPRPMTGEERSQFLMEIFSQCEWGLE